MTVIDRHRHARAARRRRRPRHESARADREPRRQPRRTERQRVTRIPVRRLKLQRRDRHPRDPRLRTRIGEHRRHVARHFGFEDDVYPVVGRQVAVARHHATRAVHVQAVAATLAISQEVQRTVGQALGGEESTVIRVAACRRQIRCNVDRVRGDRHRRSECNLLPAGRGLVHEGGGRQATPVERPETSGVSAGVPGSLVEPYAGHVAVHRRPELHPKLH